MTEAISKSNLDWFGNILPMSIGSTGKITHVDLELITQRDKIKGCSNIERATLEGETMIYGLGGVGGILPSEVKRNFEVSLTRDEIIRSLAGENFSAIASPETISSAKADIMVAIAEIANRANVRLTDKEKEELANFSVYLIKKVGSVV